MNARLQPGLSIYDDTATIATVEHPQGLEVVFEGRDPIVDVVALHGLNGHREKTWTAENGTNWLRHLLPDNLPRARILCWGYDANTHATDRVSWQHLYDHARTLVSDLCRKRKMTDSTNRPIIFVAHSLGGLVLKSALIHSDAARQGALAEHRSIKLSTYGILFMGTPHQGGNGVQLGRVLANVASLVIAADERLLKHLERDSEWLQQQLGQYAPISNEFITKFAYEEYATLTVLGRSIMVVPRASAVVPGHADAEPIVIHANHTSMVRYPSRQDTGYVTVSEHLQIMALSATDSVQQRWARERRADDARGNVDRFSLPLSQPGAVQTTHFVAREEELAWIHQKLERGAERSTVVVHGLGGMGKTQLAIAYMKRHRNDYSASIWLNARDKTSLNQSFRIAAIKIIREHPGLTYMQAAVSDNDGDASLAVRRWLDESRNNRWLLIYDNYDHPKMEGDTGVGPVGKAGSLDGCNETDQSTLEGYDIRQHLPDTDHGAIIVTTRSSTVQIGELLRLQKLRKVEDSLRILESTSGRRGTRDDASAMALACKLDGLPLALSTAGAYLAQVSTSWRQYLQDYESTWGQLQKLSPQLLTYENRAMYSTWNISYASIRRRNKSAAMLLRLWAFFGNEDLWYELVRQGGTDGGPKWLQDLTETRLAFDHGEEVPEYWLIQRRLLLHADRCWQLLNEIASDEVSVKISATLGNLYVTQRRLKEAEAMYERALQGKEKAWGPEHTSTLDTVNNLGVLYADQGRLQEAEAMYKRALQGYEKAWGPEHTSTLDTVNNLGNLFQNQGRLQEAEAMYERALQGKEKACGPEHTSTLNTVNNLGVLYMDRGRLKEAEAMYERALQGKEKAWGPEHTSTLSTVNNLGNLYKDQRRLQEAEAMYKRALQGYEKAWGPEHTSTLDTVNNLGVLYADQGRLQEAEAMYERALQGKEEAWGPEHTSTLSTVNNLGNLYADRGRLKDAEAMYERAQQGYEKAWGPEHTSTLDTVNNLGNLYADQGWLQEAEAMYERALQGYEKAWGPEHTSTLDTVNNLGNLYKDQGRLQEAEAMYERALQGKEKAWGPEHTSTLDTVNNLGNLYKDQGRLQEAEAMYERALQGKEKAWGPEHTSTLDTVNNLGNLFQNQGRLQEAEAMYERALQGKEKAWGPGSA
ncbi:uncharacterized protein LMH87_007687 [Akanthomyces muscarius]|uniref:DUF676 domain-containing protein n=1 Tax=Akanthomyces muscarius TaxID=2231603 RepID=A0A9W8QLD8_AKAMU|nr:uncharacterized protein LMH87_007687 [Akanthomyces muscarius]KAJ4161661.1 hypothetical protein LMH87_007687 [Akanthomyces muscarius]